MTRAARAVACGLLLAGAACREPIGNGWDWNRMRVQPKTTSYGANAALPDGSTMHPPPLGTVPAGFTTIPVPTGPDRGAGRFAIFCAPCHGIRGDGRSLVARNIDPPLPGSLLAGAAAARSDPQLDSIIISGFGTMNGFGSDIPPSDRRAIVGYLRQLQRGPAR